MSSAFLGWLSRGRPSLRGGAAAALTDTPLVSESVAPSQESVEDPPRRRADAHFVPAHQRLKTFTATAVAATSLGLATLAATAGPGAGTDVDQSFLREISDLGIGFTSSARVIDTAQHVCRDLGNGQNGAAVRRYLLTRTHLGSHQATHFITAAVTSYCPQYSSQIPT